MHNRKVLQDWMGVLPWIQQGVILSSLRGPDDMYSPNTKNINRWIRGVTMENADPSNEYIGQENLPKISELFGELEYKTSHYLSHLMEALEIIGYKHLSEEIRKTANDYYLGLASLLHLNPETKEQLDRRLEDKV